MIPLNPAVGQRMPLDLEHAYAMRFQQRPGQWMQEGRAAQAAQRLNQHGIGFDAQQQMALENDIRRIMGQQTAAQQQQQPVQNKAPMAPQVAQTATPNASGLTRVSAGMYRNAAGALVADTDGRIPRAKPQQPAAPAAPMAPGQYRGEDRLAYAAGAKAGVGANAGALRGSARKAFYAGVPRG